MGINKARTHRSEPDIVKPKSDIFELGLFSKLGASPSQIKES